MHQSWTQADSPQWCSANLVPATFKVLLREISRHLPENLVPIVFARGLQDSVACAYVVHEEIAPGMNRLGTECRWNRKSSPVDLCSRRCSPQRLDMARDTADLFHQGETSLRGDAGGKLCIARGRLGSANEAGEVVDVGKAVRPRRVIRLGARVA